MKAKILFLAVTVATTSLLFTACQKDSADENVSTETEASTHSDDENFFSTESDAAINDADAQLETTAGFTGRGSEVQSIICDATVVVDTTVNPRTITITFNGTNCLGNRTRTGVIVISMAQGIRWQNAGAAVNVSFQNFKVTRVRDNKSVTINGTKTYTNVSGGLLINLPALNQITHTVTSSNMSVTFDNGSQRSWQIAKQRVFTYNNGVVITSSGTHTDGNLANIAEWGTNRFGRSFTTSTTQPVVIRQDCNFRVTGGQVKHTTPAFTSDVTFGLDVTGNPTGCPGNNFYYMKIIWTATGGNSRTLILPY
jgi:hypothetical protein